MQLDLNHLLRLARRWWWLLLLAPLVGGTTAFVASSQQPNLYAAETTLLVDAGVSNGTAPGSVQSGQTLTGTYSLWALSRPVLERVAEDLAYEGGAEALQRNVSSSPVPGTLFITIRASDTDPEQAALIANTVAKHFVLRLEEQSDSQNTQVRTNIDAEITETSQEVKELDQAIQRMQTRQEELSVAERQQLERMVADRDELRDNLSQLRTTMRSIDVTLASAQSRIGVSSPAVAPMDPYAPATTRSAMTGVLIGMILGVAAVIVLEYLDNTVRSREEIEQLTNSPVLATVASAPEVQRNGRQLFVLGAPRSGPAESIRLLRANLEFANAPGPIRSLVISSAAPGEGKSTVTANLGVVMAQAGLRTVIIDADLRRPTQHHIFGVNNDQGLSTLLMRPDEDWRTGATRLNIPGLTLIPSGPLPPNPSDLLSMDRFDRLLEEIRKTADVILIDTSPALSVSDALVVATKCDGALLVCRTGHTRRNALRRATLTFEQGNVQLMGLVMNQNKSEDDTYGQYDPVAMDEQSSRTRYYYGRYGTDLPTIAPSAPAGSRERKRELVEPRAIAQEM